ncbi:MAG: hypothetical protein ACRCUY_05355 [Thermoguttaceae bacterium]
MQIHPEKAATATTMPNSPQNDDNLGFLTVLEHERTGLIGGYLVLNSTGRPLEFHCTVPMKPSRAQEILYGNTLKPFLFGEQIARTLLAIAKIPVSFVATNIPDVLTVQTLSMTPIVYVFSPNHTAKSRDAKNHTAENYSVEHRDSENLQEASDNSPNLSIEFEESLKSFGIEKTKNSCRHEIDTETLSLPDVAGLDLSRWKKEQIGNRLIAIPELYSVDWNNILAGIKNSSRIVDLAEPFDRIRLAIEETQRS